MTVDVRIDYLRYISDWALNWFTIGIKVAANWECLK
jgi:hypothetical protein